MEDDFGERVRQYFYLENKPFLIDKNEKPYKNVVQEVFDNRGVLIDQASYPQKIKDGGEILDKGYYYGSLLDCSTEDSVFWEYSIVFKSAVTDLAPIRVQRKRNKIHALCIFESSSVYLTCSARNNFWSNFRRRFW